MDDRDDGSRLLRGLLGVGATWGIAWALIGALIGVVIGMVFPESWGWANPVVEWALGMGAYGAVSGVGFGAVLAHRERQRSVAELSPARAALWGALGSVLVPLLFGALGMFASGTTALDVLGAMGVTALLGGSFAAGSVAVARSADVRVAAGDEAALLEPARTAEPEPLDARLRERERR